MITSHRGPSKRAVAGLAAGLLVFSGLALAATPANAQGAFDFDDRLAGVDRFATAADIAVKTYGTADTVLLATGVKFPDALTGNYLAGAIGDTPLLLTLPDAVPTATRDALDDLGAKNVIILGGTTAVTQAVEDDLDDDFTVERFGGTNRYETAEDVAVEAAGQSDTGTAGIFEGKRTAILGDGEAYPDVLASGPLGYAKGFPITITFPNALRPETRRVLDDLDIEQVLIVGGTDAISAGVEAEVEELTGSDARRVAGDDRFETAAAIADFAYDELDFDVTHVNLARGDDARAPGGVPQGFADALTGGPHGGEDFSPILLTDPNELPEVTRALLAERCPTLTGGHIFGGFRAVSQAVEDEAVEAASGCETAPVDPTEPTVPPATATSTIAVTPDDDATATVTVNADTTPVDDRTFNVANLTAGETYRITLVRCENVQGSGSGATFLSEAAAGSSTGFAAVTGTPTADITSVNGASTVPAPATGTVTVGTTTFVADGTTATFVVDGDTSECVVPVVYFDSTTRDPDEGGNIPRLEVAGPAGSFSAPVEDFDTGGRTNFVGGNGRIVFEAGGDIFTVNPDGSVPLNITNDPASDVFPAWSPDASRITFSSDRAEARNSDVYIMNADGTGVTRLTDAPGEDRGASLTSDNQRIVFHSARDRDASHAFDIFTMNPDGTAQTKIFTNGSAAHTCGNSRTGTIVFNSSGDPLGTNPSNGTSPMGAPLRDFEIFTMDMDGSNVVQVTNNTVLDSGPKWSPDCSMISYNTLETVGDPMKASLDVHRINADGTGDVNLTNTPGIFDAFSDFSPDGTRIVFSSNRDGNFEIYTSSSLDGSNVTRLTLTDQTAEFRGDWGIGQILDR